MKKLIAVVTIPHTGTRSLMNIVDQEGYTEYNNILHSTKEERKLKDRSNVYLWLDGQRQHIYLSEYALIYKDDSILLENVINVIHGHVNRDNVPVIKFLNNRTRIITTCRDPLLTLISVNQRDKSKPKDGNYKLGTSQRMEDEFHAWELWAKHIYPFNPFIIPIDLKGKDLKHLNFDFSAVYSINVTNPKNVGGYPLRTAYDEGNLDLIKEELGENYDILLDMKSLLKPILEEIGYRDLLWWK